MTIQVSLSFEDDYATALYFGQRLGHADRVQLINRLQVQVDDTDRTGTRGPAAPKPEVAAEPARPSGTTAGTATATGGTSPTPSSAPASASREMPATAPAVDAGALRTKIRAVLGPLMADKAKAPKVTELVQEFGGTVSQVPADKLDDLLAKAQALASEA